jgi:hypothetical protein
VCGNSIVAKISSANSNLADVKSVMGKRKGDGVSRKGEGLAAVYSGFGNVHCQVVGFEDGNEVGGKFGQVGAIGGIEEELHVVVFSDANGVRMITLVFDEDVSDGNVEAEGGGGVALRDSFVEGIGWTFCGGEKTKKSGFLDFFVTQRLGATRKTTCARRFFRKKVLHTRVIISCGKE